MKQIMKGREPRSLTEHRAASHASYDNYNDKTGLREALLGEQGSLCCYCMSRISSAKMKIEHWAAQETHPARQLDYRNLLGACLGGQGLARAQQSCDTHKGSLAISIHPADPSGRCEQLIEYGSDGEIDASQPDVARDLRVTLNLNTREMREARKAAMDAAVRAIARKYPEGWSDAILEREIKRWRERDEQGMYRPYCQAIVFRLEKRLRGRGRRSLGPSGLG
jgi:uncharacterized protein (TIGR02646 family)